MKRQVRHIIALILAAGLCLICPGCSQKTKYRRTYYEYFDTVTVVYGYDESERDFEAVCDAVESVISKYHKLADIYHEYSGINNLKSVNDSAGIAPVAVDRELLELLDYALTLGENSGGALNCAMGAVLNIWHTYRTAALEGGAAAVPTAEELTLAGQHCSAENVIVDFEAGTIFLKDPEMRLDLGAVAKGYAAERAAEAALAAGGSGYVLDVGGNLRVLGAKPDEKPWVVGVQDPFSDGRDYIEKLAIRQGALATSGDYQRFYEADGVKYHHIIDPDTLYPSSRYKSVTVLAPDAGLADALSTALFNMDYDAGANLVSQLGADAYWVLPDGEIRMTAGFGDSIQK